MNRSRVVVVSRRPARTTTVSLPCDMPIVSVRSHANERSGVLESTDATQRTAHPHRRRRDAVIEGTLPSLPSLPTSRSLAVQRVTNLPRVIGGVNGCSHRLENKRRRRPLGTAPIRCWPFPAIFFKAPSNVDAYTFGNGFRLASEHFSRSLSFNPS